MKNHFRYYTVLASFFVLFACSKENKIQVEEETTNQELKEEGYTLTKSQFESSGMKLGKMEMKTFHSRVKANGVFDVPPENRASVSSYFGGTVKDIRLLPGEKVSQGQVLFTLENPDYVEIQQDFLEAKGQLVYLKSDYERQKNLAQDNISSQKNYLKAESDYTVTRVKMEGLRKKLVLMNINPNKLTMENIRTVLEVRSPIKGFITQVNISKGAFLSPSQAAIDIVDTDHLHLELNIFEKDFPKVRIGQRIQFKIQAEEDQEYEAQVYLLNKTVDPEKRTIGIHGHLSGDKSLPAFNPGMYVEAEIYTSSESKRSLAQEALVEVEGKYYALVLEKSSKEGYSFKKKELKVGVSQNDYFEILNSQAFDAKDEFLVKGAFNLISE